MPRYALTIAYDGTDFHGWQKQEPPAPALPGAPALLTHEPDAAPARTGRLTLRTVQEVVERAVRHIVREPVLLKGASRTDSGVHARGQVATFACSDGSGPDSRGQGWPIDRGVDRLVLALNSRLPDDVIILDARPVPDDGSFDVITSVASKGYSYTLHVSRSRPLWDRRYVHHEYDELDLAAMQHAAALFVGEHDFAAFAAAGHGRLSTVRTVHACSVDNDTAAVLRPGERRIRIDISSSGFLWNMVRIIAGTLVDVGKHRRTLDDIRTALATGDRRTAGPTLPPTGLCLEWIRYADAAAP